MGRKDEPSIKRKPAASALPTGLCWCGCRGKTKTGKFFLPSHDRKAEAALIKAEYGSIAELLARHGYGPENSVVAPSARGAG